MKVVIFLILTTSFALTQSFYIHTQNCSVYETSEEVITYTKDDSIPGSLWFHIKTDSADHPIEDIRGNFFYDKGYHGFFLIGQTNETSYWTDNNPFTVGEGDIWRWLSPYESWITLEAFQFQSKVTLQWVEVKFDSKWHKIYFDAATGIGVAEEISEDFVLYQNYPNPFNPTTTIQYNIAESSSVYLAIYNLLGKEIEVLVNEVQMPGQYSVEFEALNIPAGIYFYKIQTENKTVIKRMTLVK